MSTRKNIALKTHPESASFQEKSVYSWVHTNFLYCFLLIALVWIVGLSYYIEYFIGWSSIVALNPADFGVFLIATAVPLVLLWFLLAYIDRSANLSDNVDLFNSYMNSLMYPDDNATRTAQAIAQVIKEQIGVFHKETTLAIEQSAIIRDDLNARVRELSQILHLLDDYSGKTLVNLNDGIKQLADRCSYITNKTTNTIHHLEDSNEFILKTSESFLSKINPILDEISAVSSNIKNSIQDNKLYLTEMKDLLEQSAGTTEKTVLDLLGKTNDNTVRIERAFYKITDEYSALYKRLDTNVSGIEGRIEDQKRLLSTQNKLLNNNSELLSSKISKYGKDLSLEIDKLVKASVELEKLTKHQISAFKNVSVESDKASQRIANTFDEKRAELEQHSEYAINSMQNVAVALNKEIEKLTNLTTVTQIKNSDLQNIAETLVEKITDISSKLALKTDDIKDKAVDVIDKFTEASEIISQNTEKLNASSGRLLQNEKESIRILEEQNFHITNALNNIDLVKDKLGGLKTAIEKSSEEITTSLSSYGKQIDKYETAKQSIVKIEQPTQELNKDKLVATAKELIRHLQKVNIRIEKLYSEIDMFDLWNSYIDGNNQAFMEILSGKLAHKQISVIRKSFDDNINFHNAVINYLFLMDIFIKNIISTTYGDQNELINVAVRHSLDKLYFVLIKALNNAE